MATSYVTVEAKWARLGQELASRGGTISVRVPGLPGDDGPPGADGAPGPNIITPGVTIAGVGTTAGHLAGFAGGLVADVDPATLAVATAEELATPRNINGVAFDGSKDITISASATPGGAAGQLQFNNAGVFAGLAGSVIQISSPYITITSQANAHVPLRLEGNGTGNTQTGDLLQFRALTGLISRVNYRGAFIINGPDTVAGQLADFYCPGYAYLGGIRINGSDAADNNMYNSGRNIGFATDDNPTYSIVFRTTSRRLATVGSVASLNDPEFALWAQAGTATNRQVGSIRGVFQTGLADATRQGIITIGATDFAAWREGIRIRGNGTTVLMSFFGLTTPVAKPTVTGSRGGNAALASLLTALASLGLITDSSS